ncbi:MAG TPA: MFS transporter [Acidimicrobiales bacterium]|nr:MFS transporter [Acidimicrobiales bacterium]
MTGTRPEAPIGAGESVAESRDGAAAAAGGVLLILASGQFLMTLDSSVMNVSIASVAEDIGTTVTGIQTAITFYALVMAAFMITGGKIGSIIGRRRAFSIGCVIYGVGSLTTALAPNLAVLLVGWSVLEGLGAALIMPAIVGLVAANVPREGRPRAYGLVASAGAIAVAAGPLIGGLVTTYASWRWVFAGEVVVVAVIVLSARRLGDEEPGGEEHHLDLVGTALSALGLALLVFGVLRSSEWGWIAPRPGGEEWLGLSPVVWLLLASTAFLYAFMRWEMHVVDRGGDPLLRPGMLRNSRLRSGLTMFFFQYFVQGGLFFVVPLFLSIVVGLSAAGTGVRLLPLSVTLLLAAVAIPRFRPHVSPRLVVQLGLGALLVGIVVLVAALDVGSGAEVTTGPLLLAGLGVGALASQLGSVTVSSVPDEQSGEVGGLQNTGSNLGTSVGTALIGSILIATLSASVLGGIEDNEAVSEEVRTAATVEFAGGVPFVADDDLEEALLTAGVAPDEASAIVDENEEARIVGLRVSLAVLALVVLLALFFAHGVPAVQPADEAATAVPGGP